MPVFEFRGEDSAPYKILTDHFQRLWETSTDDLLHMGAMYSDVEKYLDEHVFSPRLPWLSVVVEALGQKEKRSSPRRMYDFPVILKTTDTAQTWNARLKDCSSGGARLECEMPGPDSDFHLTAGAEVAVSVDSQMANPQTRFFRENLFEEENTQYRIEDVRKNGDMTKPRYDVRIKRAA
jgi:hypothetical protein